MRYLRKITIVGGLASLLALAGDGLPAAGNEKTGASGKRQLKAQEKRSEIDAVARESLDRVLKDAPGASDLFAEAAGYAVFDNLKISFIFSGGGGVGVAVHKGSDQRTYMKMGTAGVGLGLGGQKYQVVFLFQTDDVFENFVEKGWQADAQANAVAGKAGANAEAAFIDGMAFYVVTEAGLMLQADISGTKYWKYDRLN